MTSDEFTRAVTTALETLGLAGDVQVTSATIAEDGTALARLAIRRDPGADAQVRLAAGLDAGGVPREIRGELRRALRLCPLCQRLGHVEKIRDAAGAHDACAVACPSCGRYEIDQSLIKDLRTAWERGDPDVLGRLPALSDDLRQGRAGRITRDWLHEPER